MPNAPIPDHGAFEIQVENEPTLVAMAVQNASANLERPGQFWLRIASRQDWPDGRVLFGNRQYHVDLIDRTLVITQEWNAVETARRTMALEDQA